MSKEVEGISYKSNVHCVLYCDEEDCDFEATYYTTAIKEAEAHHRETGHELRGEQGLAIWVGREGNRLLQEHVNHMMHAMGFPGYGKDE